jgi:hypothetical protein
VTIPFQLDKDLLARVAAVSLAEVFCHARRGDVKAATYLVSQHLGEPPQSVSQRIESMTGDEGS